MMTFEEFFKTGTGDRNDPFPYQVRLGDVERPLPGLMSVPTGCGKTLAILVSWLFRLEARPSNTPRRLVYCLPMRVLVEQVAEEAREVLSNLGRLAATPGEPGKVSVYVLQGGEIDRDWDRFPESQAILVGTQDQLISRALNRGYAMSRARWPIAFSLLHDDAQWVFDEIQLMNAGLGTSAQLEGFRNTFPKGFHPTHTLWMSATPTPAGLQTPDFRAEAELLSRQTFVLEDEDKKDPQLSKRLTSRKALHKSSVVITRNLKKPEDYARELAPIVLDNHELGKLTLVVCNTVDRAQELAKILRDKLDAESLLLIHSRFRARDRQDLNSKLRDLKRNGPPANGMILVSTQVIEAGVDLDAHTLITDSAPWNSMVQRIGRCNRRGNYNDAKIIWIPMDGDEKDGIFAPYAMDETCSAIDALENLDDAGPNTLGNVSIEATHPTHHILRKREFLELFDTTPDLAGNDLDISRYIRDGDENDVQVFWREIPGPEEDVSHQPAPSPLELCSISIWKFKEWTKKNHLKPDNKHLAVWRHNALHGDWERLDRDSWVAPGMVFMVSSEVGGYNEFLGWTGDKRGKKDLPVSQLQEQNELPPEGLEDDRASQQSNALTIDQHCTDVYHECLKLIESLNIEGDFREALLTAARWHDAGKAHPIFQNWILQGMETSPQDNGKTRWAKSEKRIFAKKERPHFRHEVASALAFLQNGGDDLAAYLIMSHHGKVRLSLRSFPGETPPVDNPNLRFARGIHEGDVLPQTDLGGGITMPETSLDLEIMELGESADGKPSWTARTLALRDQYGPFALAYLESILRIADWRASAE